MFILPLLLACSSVIPDTAPNPVDKLAGYADVRLGQKIADIPGLVRDPKSDNYEHKEEAYTRPADKAYFMMGLTYISASDTPTYAVRDGVLHSVRIAVKDRLFMAYGTEVPDPILSQYDCRTLIEALTKLLGKPVESEEPEYRDYTWAGDLSETRVGTYTGSDGDRTCFYSTRMQKDSQ